MIVIGNWFSNDVSLFLGYNNGTWGTKIFLSTGANLYSIATGDLNNDNNFDILVGHNGASSAVVVGDFNGDNRLDVAIANYGSNSMEIILNTCQ
ncbi:unnamed protein product [Rotaria magnacalcarata]|uniref:VCBS repeat-containing protein n=1 Tax=Rotaria magnacalcarata TaxID=392030 RepID=A0A816QL56_9BILA|nr:unnamed protein product [Rotaria magnacalcarata]CAF3799680.1 unnamed protein product [Rotaria magnacalcarata]CAF5143646.1 unnamed protein product [Rotaria magnacalcarata]CAF5215215.1 unnamed protein product [Rotaria magnacalcarata]